MLQCCLVAWKYSTTTFYGDIMRIYYHVLCSYRFHWCPIYSLHMIFFQFNLTQNIINILLLILHDSIKHNITIFSVCSELITLEKTVSSIHIFWQKYVTGSYLKLFDLIVYIVTLCLNTLIFYKFPGNCIPLPSEQHKNNIKKIE